MFIHYYVIFRILSFVFQGEDGVSGFAGKPGFPGKDVSFERDAFEVPPTPGDES